MQTRAYRKSGMTYVAAYSRYGSKYVLATMVLAAVALSGCTITAKRFTPQESQRRVLAFSEHELETLFENSIYAKNDNLFSIKICQRQKAPPDSVDSSTLDYVRLEDLSISFSGTGDPVFPAPENPANPGWREILEEDGFLHGPMYNWGWLHIPKDCEWIEITYTAILVSGDASSEIGHRTIRQVLYRKHEKISSLAH